MGRPEATQHDALSREELAALQRRLAAMSMTAVRDFYFAAYLRCRPENDGVPSARAIQELVQAWKQLRPRNSGARQ
jgi:hypothetical protein